MAISPVKPLLGEFVERADPLRIQVAKKLREMLRMGRIRPGMRLTEKGVADMLGVSRTPAREALGVLAESGVLDTLDQGGYVVPQLTQRDVEEMYLMRELLEVPALKLSVRAAKQEFLERLADCLARLQAALDDFASVAFFEGILEFREILFHNCGNETLFRAILQLDNHAEYLKIAVMEDREMRARVVDLYRRIVEAIARRDAREAVTLLRAHHADGQSAYSARLQP